MYQKQHFPSLCSSCRQRPPLWEASLCATCQAKLKQRQRLQQIWSASPRWFIISLSDGMIGMLVGLILWAPITGSIGAQLIGICVLTTIIAILQWILLRHHIPHTVIWVVLNAFSLILTWLILEGIQLHTIEDVAIIEIVTGIGNSSFQAYLLRNQIRTPIRWIAIGSIIAILAAGSTVVAKLVIPVAPLNFIGGVAIGRCVYSFLLGSALTWQATTNQKQPNLIS
jgi:hypothetical protein